MGQNQSGKINSIFEDWKIYQNEQKTFINIKTNQLAEQNVITLKKTQQSQLKKRMEDHHNFIAKILYYQPVQKNKISQDQAKYYVYTQKLYPLCNQLWVPINSALSILKGYRRLSSTYGLMRIRQDMIKVNNKKQIKVWINKNFIKNDVIARAQNQQQMLVDIVKIIMEFDSQTGSLMVNCFTLNQAINNILQSISQSKSALHFSSRTNKKQEKPRIYQKQASLGNNKNNVRSTKQTEDDSLRPFNQSSLKQMSNNQLQTNTQQKQKQAQINYLQGVSTLKSPTYINLSKMNESPSKIQVNLRKDKNDNAAVSFNYSQQNNCQKQSSIQFNNTQPQLGKLGTAVITREYKPIQYRNQNSTQQIQNYNSANRVQNEKSLKQNNKNKQGLYKQYEKGRKSNLTKTELQKLENNQNEGQNNLVEMEKNNTNIQNNYNQNSDNTSRQFTNITQNQLNKNIFINQNFNLLHFDSTRTKTQQFYTSSAINSNSSRLKTNFVNTNTFNTKSPINQNPTNEIKIKNIVDQVCKDPIQNKKKQQNLYNRPLELSDLQPKKQKYQIKTQPPEDEKRQMKLRQAQKIKQQMCNLGIINNNNTKSLISQKSVRDLLIKQRVEQKNKKHAQLKSAITKLLNQ